jgi:hypothetical protein
MKRIKRKKLAIKTASVIILLSSMSLRISAQELACFPDPKSSLGLFAKREQHLYKTLSLSKEQLLQIDTINDEYITNWQALREDKTHSRKEKRQLKKRLQDNRDKQFKDVLNEEQRNRWNKIRQTAAIRKAKNLNKP